MLHGGQLTLEPGTYVFDHLRLDEGVTLTVNGPVEVYFRGLMMISHDCEINEGGLPANFQVKYVGNGDRVLHINNRGRPRRFHPFSIIHDAKFTGTASGHKMKAWLSGDITGALAMDFIRLQHNTRDSSGNVHYDI